MSLRKKLSPKTKAVIVNTPNNPTGVVYSEETIQKLAAILEKKQKEFGTEIYLISDEPYRELAYDGVEVPYLTKYYANTVVGYSFSKSLSLPGERIGYLVIPDEVADSEKLNAAANVATRILGFVNAPTLQQKVVKACLNEKTDISYYDRNRETLYNGLKKLGFECIKPEGAFYLFVKSPVADEKEFCNTAKKYNILIVPGSSFGCPGYVRMAYCVAYETIVNALPQNLRSLRESIDRGSTMAVREELLRNIRSVEPYVPGEQPQHKVVKLNTNENPYPPAPGVERVLKEMDTDRFRLYPDPTADELVGSLADYYGVGKDQVFVGVGSDDVISMCFLTFF